MRVTTIDMRGVEEFDTYGGWLLERLTRACRAHGQDIRVLDLPGRYQGLLDEVQRVNRRPAETRKTESKVFRFLEAVGLAVADIGRDLVAFLNMIGALGYAVMGVLRSPRSFRLTSAVHHLDRVGWQAVPIILLITVLIGGIIAQQGFFHFRKFGADEYVVDMVGILVLRELGVLIVAIMVAGRSGSSYTAELGSMKMREEIDALRTMGLDPVHVLILPRVAALVVALPLLTLLGSLAALYGGGPRGLAVRRHESGNLRGASQGGDLRHAFQGRHDQGAIHGAGDRRRGLLRGPQGERQCRVARVADDNIRGQVDLPGDRARWAVRHILCVYRDVSR